MDTLMERLRANGETEFYHWQSDLYVRATRHNHDIIRCWFRDRNMNPDLFVSSFRDLTTGRMMYEVAFAYDPFWSVRNR